MPEEKDEVGRELEVDELRENTIVFTNPSHMPKVFASVWVEKITADMIFFYAGELKLTLCVFRQPDGTLKDGFDHQIHVFEYLGEYPT